VEVHRLYQGRLAAVKETLQTIENGPVAELNRQLTSRGMPTLGDAARRPAADDMP
jgi:hypothetical protein